MSEITPRLHYRKAGVTTDIKLYNSTVDVGNDRLSLRVNGATAYAMLGGTGESYASDLRVRKAGSTYAVLTENKIDLPSGFIAMFDTTCPTGWTRESAFDNKFIRGAAAYGGTGGDNDHTHGYTIPTTYSGYHIATLNIREYEGLAMPPSNHRHRFLGRSFTSDSGSTLPNYIKVVYCRKD